MEAELLSGQGMLDHAFALVEKVLSNTTRDKEDCTPIFIKASLTINKVQIIFNCTVASSPSNLSCYCLLLLLLL